ncbi:unnamed protein product [Microthlaspi erraticum]|uniref:Protein kinase domain-containing protein n=1 Tax=Microthlaspi erraticum TaxID=1685480 RepID=A0A6D2HX53_9BRAS|nr:unnamed protein product [Microthlaspi erraticum]
MAVTSFLDTVFRRRKKKPTEFINIFEFDYDTIRVATDEFSNRIARGLCSVYKGRLQNGQEIAVKILSQSSVRTEREFRNEVEILSKLKHKNLISLLGFCFKRDQYCLVYEFMPNLNLHRFIFDPNRASQLNWEMCRDVIQGVAQGLRYLHEESGLRVVHRDIGENEAESTEISGTLGFLDPYYIRSLRFSVKSDVYAFGVTILTIISRRRDYDYEEEPLIIYVMGCWNRGEAINVIHEVMREQERGDSIREILRYIHIALLCIDENAETRPSLDKVLHWFSCFSTPLPEPAISIQFLVEEDTNQSLSPSLSPGHSSVLSPMSSRYGD